MSYEKSLFNGDDPLYAPGLTWSGKKKDTPYWRVTPKYRKLGYPTSSIRLTGKKDDGQDIERARECRKHTRNMLAYFGVDVPKEDMGTWAWLISRYLTDRHSPIRGVKENTRQNYEWCLMRWKAAIGHIRIEQMDYIMLCDLVEGMRENGRSAAYISRMFNRLRAITKYGKMIKAKGAADVSEILNEMRIPMPQRRSVIATREHVRAIVDEADARGMFGFATGLLIQWVYCLRAVDVRGQWLPCDPEAGGYRPEGHIEA